MNRIYKVIYSKVKQCAVVVSELAKSHCKTTTTEHRVKGTALTAAVLMALTSVGFMAAPLTAQADTLSNNLIGINHYYFTGKTDKEGNPEVKVADLDWLKKNAANFNGQGANAQTTMGAITIGMNAVSGKDTITIGDRNAIQATQSVLIGSNYGAQHQTKPQTGSNVVAVGYESDATGNGSIAIGSSASADPWKNVSDKDKTNANKNNNSIAVGYKAQAQKNNIAIGANSVATDAASKETAKFRDNTDSDYNAPSSYVSVGSSTLKRRITNVAAGADENDVATVGQLKKVADNKVAWKLTTAGNNDNASTVSAGDTVDFSAAKDSKENGQATGKDHSNLTISKEKENGTNKVNMTVGLSDNVVLGQNASGKGGSLDVYRAVGDASSNQLGSHVRIDGSTVSVRYDNGTDSNARGAVLGIANDSYQDTNDATKTVSSPLGYVYLRDGGNYYYLHGAMHGDTNYQGRLAYDTESGSNYIANLDDGLKFTGDTENTTVETKLDPNATNNTLSITGGVTDSGELTSGNIGVVATANTTDENGNVTSAGGLSIQLAKNLTGITSISNQTTGAKITFGTDGVTTISGGDVSVSDNKITNIKAGEVKENSKDAVNGGQLYNEQKARTDADTAINNKIGTFDNSKTYNYIDKTASISTNLTTLDTHVKKNAEDISQINTRIDTLDGNAVKYDDSAKSKITLAGSDGTTIDHVKDGTISSTSKEAVNGGQLYNEQKARTDADTAINNKIGTFDNSKTYNYIDKTASISTNLTTLDTHVKKNAEDISQINTRIDTLDGNAVKYDDSAKSKITLAGSDGTTIDHVKDGTISSTSKEAVNGGQLWQVDQKVDKNTTNITKNAGDITNLENLSNITNAGKTVIKNLSKDAVQIKAGTAITVDGKVDETTGNKTYTISANNNGKVAKDDGNLISGGTLYNEVHVDKDGTYIKSKDSATGKDMTVAQNLSALDSGLKTTSDLIHTNTAGDTIQIGGSSSASKIDVNGKDGKGRVITGVVSDANDPTSAANVGYVNGVTSANTQQIYRDMNNAYGRLNNNINKAAAGSNALAALHPLDYDPDDKADFAVGYGHYRNANAAAVGAFYHPNENTMVNVGVSLGNGDPGFNAGVSFKVGRGGAGREAMSKTEMAKVINSQSKEIDALKKDNADKDKRIDTLEQKMAEILAKLDKNGK